MKVTFGTLFTALDHWAVVFGVMVEPSAVIFYLGAVSVEIAW